MKNRFKENISPIMTKEEDMLSAQKLPPIEAEREEESTTFEMDSELKSALESALPKGKTFKWAFHRGALNVLNELDPRVAKKFFQIFK